MKTTDESLKIASSPHIYVVRTNLDFGTTGNFDLSATMNSNSLYTGMTPNMNVEVVKREIKNRAEIQKTL